MESISVFDMLKIGVGPSSSHTLGPWRAAQKFIKYTKENTKENIIKSLQIDLYGSLSLTGKGHATDFAVMLGLSGEDPEYIPIQNIDLIIQEIKTNHKINFNKEIIIDFNPNQQIVFNKNFLPFHANGIKFTAFYDNFTLEQTYFSIGGGFITQEIEENSKDIDLKKLPYPINLANELLEYCHQEQKSISEIVLENEKALRDTRTIDYELMRIWNTMLECIYTGCHSEGILPGGLNVKRRAFDMHQNLKGNLPYNNTQEWLENIRKTEVKFRQILKWVSCFALAVNEVNAALGRVVTAPTNGSAGVIPAVLMYYLTIENHKAGEKEIKQFLLVAGEIGSIFKKGATISAAMGGCQAEIGVSSAMAAAALCELMGGTPDQVLIAAEIAMEHHLGLTCDPIGGLVQIPCIERNTMGAIKAINAAELALETDAKNVKVPLDKVINTMWETAKDMNSKYKETSEGGLAVTVNMVDC
jgi:L-serine dehydratase